MPRGAATAVGGIDIVRGGCSESDEAYHWHALLSGRSASAGEVNSLKLDNVQGLIMQLFSASSIYKKLS